MLRNPKRSRSGATAVEFAVISPVLLLLLLGLMIGGLGVFRYHQVASLAREGARYASVRGLDYHRETGNPAATEASIREEILSRAAALDPSLLTVSVTWDQSNMPKRILSDNKTVVTNVVIVTVSYQWLPESIFGATTLSSTSKLPMTY